MKCTAQTQRERLLKSTSKTTGARSFGAHIVDPVAVTKVKQAFASANRRSVTARDELNKSNHRFETDRNQPADRPANLDAGVYLL